MTSDGFVLDQQLARDTSVVADWTLSRILLMNDRRYPWLILVPRRAGASEIFDLEATDRALLWREISAVASALKRDSACRKITVGALGNIVLQLHVHIVARREGDAAWPGPVWGKGVAEPYAPDDLQSRLQRYAALLQTPAD